MRKLLPLAIFVALLIVGLSATTAWQRAQPRAYTPRGPGDTYLALGDSLAFGLRLDDPAAQSYPALVRAALARSEPIELVNLAVPGATSSTLLRGQLPRALELIAEQRRAGRRVSPITIDIGGNDLQAVRDGNATERAAAIERLRNNLGRILDQLRAAAPDADIAVMTYYNPYGGDPGVEDGEAYWVARMNQAISAEASRRGVAVADGYTALDGGRAYTHTFILLGDIHANAQGHQLLAEAFLAALQYPAN